MSFDFKKPVIFILFFLLTSLVFRVMGQEEFRTVKNEAFKVGERLQWRFFYDSWLVGITAGHGVAEVKDTKKTFHGRSVYHIDTEGYSKGMFNWFFKVQDNFDSYMDKQFLAPHYFERRTREGGYRKDDEYRFNQAENVVMSRKDTLVAPAYLQDFISAIYYTRTFSSDTLKEGDVIPIDFFLDDSVYTSAIIFEGREIIKIKLGTFKCLRFKPGMATGEVFSDKYPMTLWVTDDKNHVPILAKSAIIVGNLKAELMEYSGLANPFTSLVELNE
ncbi:MAG: DUF3108 domain-containing protein [Bacteroidales bacterium]|nr:DUF3108 domain-containing protein [Bacteroidales bacterium]MCF8402677.1 DUF3108 domain-containing protein [Bacteroidales bacterium]